MQKLLPSCIILLSYSLGLGSLIGFLFFLFWGSFSLIPMGLDWQKVLILDAGLSLLFFIQHSMMIRRSVQEKLSKLIPNQYYSAFYAITSGIALFAVILCWQKTSIIIATADGVYRIIMRALFFLALAGFVWGNSSLQAFDPLGISKIKRHMYHKEFKPMHLAIRGAYRWLRHPLYFFCLVSIWSCPDLSAERLLFNTMWSAWIGIATVLEERDLVLDFGDQYRAYQAKVPMIIPYKIP